MTVKDDGAARRLARALVAAALLIGCSTDGERGEESTPTTTQPLPSEDDYRPAQQGRWQGVPWTLYRVGGSVCAEWTAAFEGDAPVSYPAELDLDRRSCVDRGVLTRGGGTVVQPMFSYRLPNGHVGVWGVTSSDVQSIDIQLASGQQLPSITPTDGTFGLELDEQADAGEVTVGLTDESTIECVEPSSLAELSWTCR